MPGPTYLIEADVQTLVPLNCFEGEQVQLLKLRLLQQRLRCLQPLFAPAVGSDGR